MNKAYEKITIALCESLADALIAAAPFAAAHGVTTHHVLKNLTDGKKKGVSKGTRSYVKNLIDGIKEKRKGLEEELKLGYEKAPMHKVVDGKIVRMRRSPIKIPVAQGEHGVSKPLNKDLEKMAADHASLDTDNRSLTQKQGAWRNEGDMEMHRANSRPCTLNGMILFAWLGLSRISDSQVEVVLCEVLHHIPFLRNDHYGQTVNSDLLQAEVKTQRKFSHF